MTLNIATLNTSGWNQTLFDALEWLTETAQQLLLGDHGVVLGYIRLVKGQRWKGQKSASIEEP